MLGKRVLVIGQGAREHALVWKLSQSPQVDKIFAAPGNAGMAALAECVDIQAEDVARLAAFASAERIDLTVVGPEAPLMEGLVDLFEEKGMKVFGPRANAAVIEGSKVFTKNLFKKYQIPTAAYQVFDAPEAAKTYIDQIGLPVVVKVDGLAAGKGVVIAFDAQTAYEAVDSMMLDKEFGQAGDQIVIEEFLQGEEVSVFVLTDGKHAVHLAAAQDHKRINDGDEGPNTGGMGAYSPPPLYTPALRDQVMKEIIEPVIAAMAAEGRPYKGILYAGLMVTETGLKVLEFNARLGDPEAQVVLPLLDTDLVDLMEAAIDGALDTLKISILDRACVGVVMASGGYPGKYEKGIPIHGLDQTPADLLVFHAGTRAADGQIVTNGGRVLTAVALDDSVRDAVNRVYQGMSAIRFDGMHYRKDIAFRALK